MTKLNVTGILASAATVAAITIAASGSALAHGGGAGGHPGTKTVTPTKTEKVVRIDRDRRRFRFRRFGHFDVVGAPVPACFYEWTSLGRVRICPDLAY
jgi:hypothetical protein